ncbi:MAG: FHA domain-containing protein [Chitinispirillales bacterium]|jgi:pSer/pThr/pTyr-binding forkhead associated (FHA) protein|nr:FHA domain-containing protein [Chitinispirillales bacterium]
MTRYSVYYAGELVKIYELDEPIIFIGRLPENTIPISNMGVSRRHVKIEQDTDYTYMLSDLNSLNGTLINGEKIKKKTLCHGDKIAIGKYIIIYEECGEDEPDTQSAGAALREESERIAGTAVPAGSMMKNTLTLPSVNERNSKDDVNHEAQSGAVFIETARHVVYKLDRSYLTVGCDDEDDIYASGFMVNKAFAVIEKLDDGFYISVQKLMSKIKVNGKTIKKHRLEHRDRVEIGSNTFRFMENG